MPYFNIDFCYSLLLLGHHANKHYKYWNRMYLLFSFLHLASY